MLRHPLASSASEVGKVTNFTKYNFLKRASIDFQKKLYFCNDQDVNFRVAYFTRKDASDPLQRTVGSPRRFSLSRGTVAFWLGLLLGIGQQWPV